jgi:hypothetical protein
MHYLSFSACLLPIAALVACNTDVNVGGPRTDSGATVGGDDAAGGADQGVPDEGLLDQGASDSGIPEGGVCVPDPPDAVISGSGGGQPDAPYCPWNGCLDGPKASCGSDGQWHCPQPPPPCVDAGGGIDSGGDFACGTTTCGPPQFCTIEEPGVPGGSNFYSCSPIPANCQSSTTCACIVPYLDDAGLHSGTNNVCSPGGGGFVGCTEDGAGHITVTCALP